MNKIKSLNTVFFGTSSRSKHILEALHTDTNLKLVVTKPDQKVGRKQEIKESAVKTWAKEHSIEVYETAKLRGDEDALIAKLQSLDINFGVVADFSIIIPERVIDFFKDNFINIHFSLLPRYRGACPVQFSIKNGDKKTGITFITVSPGVDEGDIIYAIEHLIESKPTAGQLYETLFKIAGDNLTNVIETYLEGKITPQKQDPLEASYTYSSFKPNTTFIFKEEAKIDWAKPVEKIEREIRAYNPWPISWTTIGDLEEGNKVLEKNEDIINSVKRDLKLKIFEASIKENRLIPQSIQLEGKGKMGWASFVNGYIRKH